MVGVSASVNLPLHHEVQKFSSALDHQGGPGERPQNGCLSVSVCVVVTFLVPAYPDCAAKEAIKRMFV